MEIARLASVVPALKAKGASISIDSFVPRGAALGAGQGVDYLNDIHGFAEPSLYPELADAKARLIVMHAVQGQGIATRADVPPGEIFGRAVSFFEQRIAGPDRGRDRPGAADPGSRHGVFCRQRSGEFPDPAAPPAGAEGPLRPAAAGLGVAQILPAQLAGQSDAASLPVLAASLAAELFAAAGAPIICAPMPRPPGGGPENPRHSGISGVKAGREGFFRTSP